MFLRGALYLKMGFEVPTMAAKLIHIWLLYTVRPCDMVFAL